MSLCFILWASMLGMSLVVGEALYLDGQRERATGMIYPFLIACFFVISIESVRAQEGGNWKQPSDKAAHIEEDKWKGNPPDKIDSDGVPVYRNRLGPVGVVYRKRSIDDPPEKGCESG